MMRDGGTSSQVALLNLIRRPTSRSRERIPRPKNEDENIDARIEIVGDD